MGPSPVILFVDDDPAIRTIFAANFADHFNLRMASSGEEALRILASEPIAVLLTDQRMPGMTGNELLERVKAEYPLTVRIMVTAYDEPGPILDAVNRGEVARYVVKPWTPNSMLEILHWAVAHHQKSQIDGPASLDSVLQAAADEEVLPRTVIDILAVLNDPTAGVAELEATYARGPGDEHVTTALARNHGGSLRDLVVDVGVEQVASIIMTAALQWHTRSDSSAALWRHALATALLARRLSRLFPTCSPVAAYASGLLHDLGRAAFLYTDRATYEILCGGQLPSIAAERKHYGFDHVIVGATIASSANLPREIVIAIQYHHEERTEMLRGSLEISPVVVAVTLGHRLAQEITSPGGQVTPDPLAPFHWLQLKPAHLQRLLDQSAVEYREMLALVLGN